MNKVFNNPAAKGQRKQRVKEIACRDDGEVTCIMEEERLQDHTLYKTELCTHWQKNGECWRGDQCAFAHGDHELKKLSPISKIRIANVVKD